MLTGLPVNLAMLTGRDKGKVREATLMGLADGSIDILVGTHAIFQEAVTYHDLALTVVDEQHQFGVAQRLLLTQRPRPPHLLVMTATPIPRTLPLSQYGEMDVSRLDEMPPGRTPVDTRMISGKARRGRRCAGAASVERQAGLLGLSAGRGSETRDMAAAEERAAALHTAFRRQGRAGPRPDEGAGQGRGMARFRGGEIAVLVATTVIEVGVDVPNATLIVIEHADRFGLAQLHQLRGRVGRGGGKSVCLLLRGAALSELARAAGDDARDQ